MSGAIFGYEFKNKSLLNEALVTGAYKIEHPESHDNQRLEFLGDSVLNFLVADELFKKYPADSEGSLTAKRASLVSTRSLCKCAEKNLLSERLFLNANSQKPSYSSKIYADAFEAIIGAAWLDGGLDAARTVLLNAGLDFEKCGAIMNHKGELQIFSQSLKNPICPVYRLLSVKGKAHEPVFTVEVSLEGFGSAVAADGSRKSAEAKAAEKLLARIREISK